MKTCFKCNETKPLEEFYRHPQMADGHLNKCKECAKKDVQVNYRKDIGKRQEYERNRNKDPNRKANQVQYLRNRRAKNPEKNLARQRTQYAKRTGKIKQLHCEKCGVPNTQAHHSDYSKPLEVMWLCFICHRKEHGQLQHLPALEAVLAP